MKGINEGLKNGLWKGDEVGYYALHEWVRKRLPKPDKCECGKEGFIELCCIGHEYKRDLSVWKYLCRSCHSSIDQKVLNIQKNRKISSCLTCGAEVKTPKKYCNVCLRLRRLSRFKNYYLSNREEICQRQRKYDSQRRGGVVSMVKDLCL